MNRRHGDSSAMNHETQTKLRQWTRQRKMGRSVARLTEKIDSIWRTSVKIETALETETYWNPAPLLVGRGRLELPTNGLKVRCSTD